MGCSPCSPCCSLELPDSPNFSLTLSTLLPLPGPLCRPSLLTFLSFPAFFWRGRGENVSECSWSTAMAWNQCLLLQKAFLDFSLPAPELKTIPYFWSYSGFLQEPSGDGGGQQSDGQQHVLYCLITSHLHRTVQAASQVRVSLGPGARPACSVSGPAPSRLIEPIATLGWRCHCYPISRR